MQLRTELVATAAASFLFPALDALGIVLKVAWRLAAVAAVCLVAPKSIKEGAQINFDKIVAGVKRDPRRLKMIYAMIMMFVYGRVKKAMNLNRLKDLAMGT